MIGVDTNVLLRLFVGDNRQQHAKARRLLARRSAGEPVHICTTVLLELVWSLRRTYGYPRNDILALLSELLDVNDVVFEQQERVAEAVERAKEDGADLPDLLIAMGNLKAGCTRTVTFDAGAANRIEGMEFLS